MRPTISRRGFTLLEILVVVVILALLVSLVAPRLLSSPPIPEPKLARQQLDALEQALDSYRLDVGMYPTTEQGLAALLHRPERATGWKGPYLKFEEVPLDPWGRAWIYVSPSADFDFDLLSLGRDGAAGGSDDDEDVLLNR